MRVDHLPHVHLVDVVAAEDGHDVRPLVGDDVLALIDRVRLIPLNQERLGALLLPGIASMNWSSMGERRAHAGDVLLERRALYCAEHLDAGEA